MVCRIGRSAFPSEGMDKEGAEKKGKMQQDDKPGSVGPLREGAVRHLSGCSVAAAFYRSTLRHVSDETWTGRPLDVGLHELSTSDVHSPKRRRSAGRLLPHLLTLTGRLACFSSLPKNKGGRRLNIATSAAQNAGGYFLLHEFALADNFPLRSGLPCVARTFLSHSEERERRTVLLQSFNCKSTNFCENGG